MTHLFEAALEVQTFLQEQGWRFCIIGGLAVQLWGQPRTTQDVDLTLLTGFGGEEGFIEKILSRFRHRRPDARQLALAARILLVNATNGVGVDISLGGLRYEKGVVTRATPFQFVPGVVLLTCSAEDLVVLKAFAERGVDWFDVEGILARQRGKLDWAYIRTQLAELCEAKDSPDILDQLERSRQKIESRLMRR
jgi:hypothetical protein